MNTEINRSSPVISLIAYQVADALGDGSRGIAPKERASLLCSSTNEANVMQLNYRGTKYDSHPVDVQMIESDAVIGHYRGADLHPRTPKQAPPAHQRVSGLKYRGATVR